MVMAVWLTLNVSAAGTGLLERALARMRPMSRRDFSLVTKQCTRREHGG
jgi:hypothetical protein